MSAIQAWSLKTGEVPAIVELTPPPETLDQSTRQLPSGFYSTFRTFDNRTKALGLPAHLDRLYQPAGVQGLNPSITPNSLRTALASLLSTFPAPEARVRLTLAADGDFAGTVFIALEPLKLPPLEAYRDGVHLLTTERHRNNPTIKSTVFVSESAGERQSKIRQDIFELLMVQNGRILEGMSSNFFYVCNAVLLTAKHGILPGITRSNVIRTAKTLQIPLEYKSLKVSEIVCLEECFITSASRAIVPVTIINDQVIGGGVPGNLTRRLMAGYEKYIQGRLENIA